MRMRTRLNWLTCRFRSGFRPTGGGVPLFKKRAPPTDGRRMDLTEVYSMVGCLHMDKRDVLLLLLAGAGGPAGIRDRRVLSAGRRG